MAFFVTAEELVLCLQDTVERCQLKLTAGSPAVPVDATRIQLSLRTLGGTVLYSEDSASPPVAGSRVQHPETGTYYFPIGDQTIVANTETRTARDLLIVWHIEVGPDAENIVQGVKVVTPYVVWMIGELRRQIDKMVKLVNDDPENPCYLGYTNKNLVEYLEGGLSSWNMYEPYPTFCTLDEFPRLYKQGLIEAAMIVGVQSQELFAIDADIPNYSAQGAAFVIQHQPQLAQFATRLAQKLDKQIPIAKLKFVRSGALHTEIAPNARLQTLINMAPNGALFRNMFISGG